MVVVISLTTDTIYRIDFSQHTWNIPPKNLYFPSDIEFHQNEWYQRVLIMLQTFHCMMGERKKAHTKKWNEQMQQKRAHRFQDALENCEKSEENTQTHGILSLY